MIALSVKQPYAESIIRGEKVIERRTVNTKIRGRIMIYASKSKAKDSEFERLSIYSEDCLYGYIIGEVSIVEVNFDSPKYLWKLEQPTRYKCPLKPMKRPQPIWFYPY